MDILKAEIAKKRKLLEEQKLVVSLRRILALQTFKGLFFRIFFQGENKKYFKRGELIEQERKTYLEKYGSKNDDTEETSNSHKISGLYI